MATEAEIKVVFDRLQTSRPTVFFKMMSDGNAGIRAALKYLHLMREPVSTGSIGEYMQVSSARTAVLIHKMESQGLIIRTEDKNDARIAMVSLSKEGEKMATEFDEKLNRSIGYVIDSIGMDKMLQFIAISDEIRRAVLDLDGEV